MEPGAKLTELRGLWALFAFCMFFLLTNSCQADDGGISFGGSPHLLKGHPSVAMQSEQVKVDVHEKIIKVDCNFVFHNSGPACTVRMGFPDQGLGAEEPYQGDPVPTGPGLHGTFLTYDSYVDGKKVPTKIVPTKDRSLYWHTKNVTFKAKSTSIIRDVYTLKPGAQVTSENGLYQQTSYVLHTGASWHGPIGKAEITINFDPDAIAVPLHFKPLSSLSVPEGRLELYKWSELPAGTVIYEGPSQPSLKERTISFVRSNFSPTRKDDIHLFYAYRKLTNGL